MDQGSEQGSDAKSLTLVQAVHEGQGKISYQQLWRGIRAGRIEAYQPSGRHGHYVISRAELERLTRPVTPPRQK